ncbi:MAG: molybdate ABC transporter substrate-binding protein [Candidatus Sumerlaeota bacterium]
MALHDATKYPHIDEPDRQIKCLPLAVFVLCVCCLFGLLSCTDPADRVRKLADVKAPVMFFVAASMSDAMTQAVDSFDGGEVKFNFAASSTLARQIEAGADADLYLSANIKWMDYLVEKGRIEKNAVRILASNRLVLVARAEKPFDFSGETDLAQAFEGRLALGDPGHVPAGIYARAALERLGWWSALESRLAPAPDVRHALRIVAGGEVDAGIVYATDAKAEKKVRVIWTFPSNSHPPVLYYIAITRNASTQSEALLEYLFKPEARAVLDAAGFQAPDGVPEKP